MAYLALWAALVCNQLHRPWRVTVIQASLNAKCYEITSNGSEARLLYHVVWWMSRAKKELHGKQWYFRSREEWMKITGLSRNRLDRAIAGLKAIEFVETTKTRTCPMLHIRVTE